MCAEPTEVSAVGRYRAATAAPAPAAPPATSPAAPAAPAVPSSRRLLTVGPGAVCVPGAGVRRGRFVLRGAHDVTFTFLVSVTSSMSEVRTVMDSCQAPASGNWTPFAVQ